MTAFSSQPLARNGSLVLDSAVHPQIPVADYEIQTGHAFEVAMRGFADDCVNSSECPLGTISADDAMAKFSTLQGALVHKPLTTGEKDVTLDDGLFANFIMHALYDGTSWPFIRTVLAEAVVGKAEVMFKVFSAQDEGGPEIEFDGDDALNAYNCADRPALPDPATYKREVIDRAIKIAPRFGRIWDGLDCIFWPVKNKQQPQPLRATGAPPILVLNNTREPATPYDWAQALTTQLESGALLTAEGDGHGVYGVDANECIITNTETYLIDTTPPRHSTTC